MMFYCVVFSEIYSQLHLCRRRAYTMLYLLALHGSTVLRAFDTNLLSDTVDSRNCKSERSLLSKQTKTLSIGFSATASTSVAGISKFSCFNLYSAHFAITHFGLTGKFFGQYIIFRGNGFSRYTICSQKLT